MCPGEPRCGGGDRDLWDEAEEGRRDGRDGSEGWRPKLQWRDDGIDAVVGLRGEKVVEAEDRRRGGAAGVAGDEAGGCGGLGLWERMTGIPGRYFCSQVTDEGRRCRAKVAGRWKDYEFLKW